jgi:hypothetical protein
MLQLIWNNQAILGLITLVFALFISHKLYKKLVDDYESFTMKALSFLSISAVIVFIFMLVYAAMTGIINIFLAKEHCGTVVSKKNWTHTSKHGSHQEYEVVLYIPELDKAANVDVSWANFEEAKVNDKACLIVSPLELDYAIKHPNLEQLRDTTSR